MTNTQQINVEEVSKFLTEAKDENRNDENFKLMHNYLRDEINRLKTEAPSHYLSIAYHQYLMGALLLRFPEMYAATCNDRTQGPIRAFVNFVNAMTNLGEAQKNQLSLPVLQQVPILFNSCMEMIRGLLIKNPNLLDNVPQPAKEKFVEHQQKYRAQINPSPAPQRSINEKQSSGCCETFKKCLPTLAGLGAGLFASYNYGLVAGALWMGAAAKVTECVVGPPQAKRR